MIAIIDYGMGNLSSIRKAVEYVGGQPLVTNNPNDLIKADKIILPGVGAFADGMANLRLLKIDEALMETVIKNKKPFLGICLGMQLLAKKSYEFGVHEGLGFLDAEIKKFDFTNSAEPLLVPHVGWNNVNFRQAIPLFKDIPNDSDFYFVHSYHLVCQNSSDIAATGDYGGEFVAAIARNNIFATQFHPEKSQQFGLKMLENFVAW